MFSVANFIGFPAVKNFRDRLRTNRVIAGYMRKDFFLGHSVVSSLSLMLTLGMLEKQWRDGGHPGRHGRIHNLPTD